MYYANEHINCNILHLQLMFLIVNSTTHVNNSAALYSRPIRPLNFGHMHASFLHAIELRCILCKKLVQEKTCTRNCDRRTSLLCKSTCTRFLYKFVTVCRWHYTTYTRAFKEQLKSHYFKLTFNVKALSLLFLTHFSESVIGYYASVIYYHSSNLPTSTRPTRYL